MAVVADMSDIFVGKVDEADVREDLRRHEHLESEIDGNPEPHVRRQARVHRVQGQAQFEQAPSSSR